MIIYFILLAVFVTGIITLIAFSDDDEEIDYEELFKKMDKE